MAEMMPIADVLWWNGENVHIRCPFCKNRHRHGNESNWRYDFNNQRVAHCNLSHIHHHVPDNEYRIQFPFDEHGRVAYEIDKGRKRFLTIGVAQDPEKPTASALMKLSESDARGEDDEDGYENDNTCPGGWEKGSVFRLDGRSGNEILRLAFGDGPDDFVDLNVVDKAMRDCINGDMAAVQKFLDISPEADIMVKGRDYEGKTMLSTAAAEKFPLMVSLILEKGTNINNRDLQGRTPLMEAALWGRSENAQILLDHGADKSMKDCDGYRALDFAMPHQRNVEERSGRAGRVYKENILKTDQEREAIVRMLDTTPPKSAIRLSCPNPASLDHHAFKHAPEESSILMMAPIATFPGVWKTIGWLERGEPFPSIAAMSGWGHDQDIVVVSGKNWNEDVFRICKLVGHSLPGHRHDRGVHGRYNACHAEKQLLAYFLSKHVFLPDELIDVDLDSRDTYFTKLFEDFIAGKIDGQRRENAARRYDMALERSLQPLWRIRPPVSLREADILVSTSVCDDCATFVSKVNTFFGLILGVRKAVIK